jgi:predicted RNA-binding Zn ribbon-like protein
VQDHTEWVNGFLLVGNQFALDFLNTRLIENGEAVELLPDVAALEKWLTTSGILISPKGKALVRRWRDSREAKSFLQKLLGFRERLRAAVIRYEAGTSPGTAFLAEVNHLLHEYPARIALSTKAGKLERAAVFEPSRPEDIWAPIAAATVELFSDVQPSRVRQCESCIVHFHDISKKGSRRWCSMNICGNKWKVAAYQRRNRSAQA